MTIANGKTPVVKPQQVLLLNPSTVISFRGDFREVVNEDLVLTNTTKRRVCFKVKTNYPHRYFVRPNGGLIEPDQQATVTIMLQPMFDSFNEDELKHHKFMVQSIIAPDGHLNGLEKLWKETKPDEVMDTKIKCVFDRIETVRQTQAELHLVSDGGSYATTATAVADDRRNLQHQKETKTLEKNSGSSGIPSAAIFFAVLLVVGFVAYGYFLSK